jgi:hypothetical protein
MNPIFQQATETIMEKLIEHQDNLVRSILSNDADNNIRASNALFHHEALIHYSQTYNSIYISSNNSERKTMEYEACKHFKGLIGLEEMENWEVVNLIKVGQKVNNIQ